MGTVGWNTSTMRVVILAACVVTITQAQRFQSFPAAQQPAQQPQFIFNPQQQVRAQQQQRQPAQQQPGVPQFNPQAVPLQFRQPAVLTQAAPQQVRQPASTQAVAQQPHRPATQQFQQPAISPAVTQQFRPQPAQQQFRPQPVVQQQFRPQPIPQPVGQPQPQLVSQPEDALGNVQVAAEQYVHDTTGDATISRFQLFKLRRKQEAEKAKLQS